MAPRGQLPEIKFPVSTEAAPLDTFLTDRAGWTRDDADTWRHADRDITIRVLAPGNANRFQCSLKGSKPTALATAVGVECWVATAGA